jgi:GNAT superfamily N-acetyltransferase
VTGLTETPAQLLARLETYYDTVPRAASRVESHGPLTLFIRQGSGWPYYARPTLGTDATTPFTKDDVTQVRERQCELGIPEAFEWVEEIAPGLRAAVEATGLEVHTHPLMVLDLNARIGQQTSAASPGNGGTQADTSQQTGSTTNPGPSGLSLRLMTADEPDDVLARADAVAAVGFKHGGTAAGDAGIAALAEVMANTPPEQLAFRRERLRIGRTVTAVAEVSEGHARYPVSVGSHQPVGEVSEVVGVATLPAYRRRGIGAAVVDLLVEDALQRGIKTVFLSAGDDDVARMYGRLGFKRIGTACIAEAED